MARPAKKRKKSNRLMVVQKKAEK